MKQQGNFSGKNRFWLAWKRPSYLYLAARSGPSEALGSAGGASGAPFYCVVQLFVCRYDPFTG